LKKVDKKNQKTESGNLSSNHPFMNNPNASPKAGPTILLVESHLTEQENFAHIALQEGWELVICNSGIDAIH